MLLLIARILTLTGWLVALLAVCLIVSSFSNPLWQFGALSGTLMLGYAFGFLIVGGILAALVAIEENMRRRTPEY
ncbi:hypothetical protein [Rudaea sp.]|uniref:hypothetical protein n=1 Tax=Rudaea sp. TaxID=2136325 RepID=UPI002ED283FC